MASCFGFSPRPDNCRVNRYSNQRTRCRFPPMDSLSLSAWCGSCRDPWEFQPQQQDGPPRGRSCGVEKPRQRIRGREGRVEVDYCGLRFAPGSCVRRSPWLEEARKLIRAFVGYAGSLGDASNNETWLDLIKNLGLPITNLLNDEKRRHGSLLQEPPIKGASLLEMLGLARGPLSLEPYQEFGLTGRQPFGSGQFSNGPSVWRYNSNCGLFNCYAPNFRD
jgi:hypothetical protein